MGQIIINIKDGYELQVAKFNEFKFDETKPPTAQEGLDAIESFIYEKMVNPAYDKITNESPLVKVKEAELAAVREAERAKFEEAKLQGK